MRQMFRWTAVASMTLGGVVYLSRPLVAADPPAADKGDVTTPAKSTAEPFAFPNGIQQKDLKEDHSIRSAFGAFEKAAMDKNGWGNLMDCLVDQDRTRMKDFKENNDDALNKVVEKIQGQWKSNYNQDFDISRPERQKAFSGLVIMTGQVANPDMLANHWPVAQSGMTAEAQTAASKQDVDQAKNKYFGGDVNLDKGRDVAIVQVPAMLGLPEVRASMIKEHTTGWRFDIPNNVTAQKFHDDLVKHLTMVADHPEQWPGNVDEAYGLIGHHALMALYQVEMPMGK
jgi:hypothetical protein